MAKTKIGPKLKKNKAAAAPEPATMGKSADGDNPLEVDLDSLGQLFIELVDTSCSHEEAATSRADNIEVIPVTSGSDQSPLNKIRRVVGGNSTYGVTGIPSMVGGNGVVRRAGLTGSTRIVYPGSGREVAQ